MSFVVPINFEIRLFLTSGWFLTIHAIASGLSPLLARGIYFGPLFFVLGSYDNYEALFKNKDGSSQHLSISSWVSCPF